MTAFGHKKNNLHRQFIEATFPDPLQSLLCLMATIILSDNRNSGSAALLLIKQSREIGLSHLTEFKISDARVIHWYELNKDTIRRALKAPYFRDWYYDKVRRLVRLPNKLSILETISKVSADHDLAFTNGIDLIILTKHYWSSAIHKSISENTYNY